MKRKKGSSKIDKEEQEYLDNLLAICVARTTMSVHFVDDENFQKFLKELNPEVKLSLFYVKLLILISFLFSILRRDERKSRT